MHTSIGTALVSTTILLTTFPLALFADGYAGASTIIQNLIASSATPQTNAPPWPRRPIAD